MSDTQDGSRPAHREQHQCPVQTAARPDVPWSSRQPRTASGPKRAQRAQAVRPHAGAPGATTPGASDPGATTPFAGNRGATTPGSSDPGANTPPAYTAGATTPPDGNPGAITPRGAQPLTPAPRGVKYAAGTIAPQRTTGVCRRLRPPQLANGVQGGVVRKTIPAGSADPTLCGLGPGRSRGPLERPLWWGGRPRIAL